MTDIPSNLQSRFSLKVALKDSLGLVFNNFFAFVRFTWVNFAVLSLIVVVTVFLAGIVASTSEAGAVLLVCVGAVACALILLGHIIIVTRNYVLGELDPPVLRVFGRVFLRAILLALILIGAVLVSVLVIALIIGVAFGMRDASYFEQNPLVALAVLGVFLIALLPVLYLVARLNTWIPAAAVERSQSLGEAWRVTKGAALKIFAGLLLIGIVSGFLDWGVGDGLASLLSINTRSFETMFVRQQLPSILIWSLVKLGIYFMTITASALFSASVFRQTETA